MKVYILGCDVDATSHGCYDSIEKCTERMNELISEQPFNTKCEAQHFYAEVYEVNSSVTGQLIDMLTLESIDTDVIDVEEE